ncbi:hypothetical protein KJ636_02095 [Patescibacteria group bacterium]|nr:hypothetical protein [Patescibacteria group bacterium]MBU4480787.1 hypothetical protein [Patescibacteria group bacterium]
MELSIFKIFKRKTRSSGIFEKGEEMKVTDFIAPSSVKVEPGLLRLGERLSKAFFVFSYPRYLTTGWFFPVINLDSPTNISFFFHPIETGNVLKQLQKRITEVQAELMEREQKGLVRDPALETAYKDIEALRDKLQTSQERMFRFGLYLTIYGDTEKEIRDIETTLRSILESKMVYIKPALYQQKEGFNSCAPYGLDQLLVHNLLNTSPLSSTFPFISFDLSSNDGILYGINQHNNSLVLFDRFSLENANFCVFAKSGSGKSILGSEAVLIKREDKIQLVKIGPLIENLIKKAGVTQIDEELEGVTNPEIEVYSFDKNLRGEWSKVTVAARKKAPEIFYRFTTQSGREITTTGDHNMLLLQNGKIIAAKSSEIKEGKFIPLPRNVSINVKSPVSLNLLQLLKNSKRIYVKGGDVLVKENYKDLKKTTLDKNLDRYLYKYRDGRFVPIQYFWKIINYLEIKDNDSRLKDLKLASKNGKNQTLFESQFRITFDFLKLIGYIAAEGTVQEDCIIISNKDQEVLKDIDSSFKNIGIPFYYGNQRIICASRLFVEIIKALGGKGKSKEKKVLPFIFNLEKEKIGQYLSAYFEGDGGVEKERIQITTTSKSKQLISEISYLLYYFGIIGRISKTKKKPTNRDWKRKKTYWKLSISGQDNLRKFAKDINFISRRKRKQLLEIIQKEGNTNVDILPGIDSIFKEIYQLFGCQLHGIQDISNLKRKHYNPSPEKLKELIKIIEERVQKFKDLTSTYKVLSELPELATLIDQVYKTPRGFVELGRNDKKFNKTLWQVLGQSWRVVKNEGVGPGSINALKMIETIYGKNYQLKEIKELVHFGFKEMDLGVKYYNRSLQPAIATCVRQNTNYEMLQKSAQFVWQNYQNILLNKIPLVEEKLAQLKALANSDLFWDPIVKIKKIKNRKEKYVYDLTVDNEVFLAGQGGMFIHNSYAVKLEILRSLMLGVDCIIVDPENEYKLLVEAVGGSFINISLASPSHINPFDLPILKEDEKPEDVLRTNIINLIGLMRLMLGGLSPEEDGILDRAITETYAAKDITPFSNPATWPEKIPLIEDLESVLGGMEGTDSLIKRLRKFTKGTYAQFFNQQTNVSCNKSLVVFGIRDMEDELRPMAMFIVMRYIWNKVRSETKKRILVIDEAWWLMQKEDSASFLYGMCKRARKYWLGITTITQDVNDFMKSNYGQAIIANSSLQFLMKQSTATMDVVQKTFNLTEGEKYMLLGAGVGEGLFFAGQKHVIIRVVASYTEDQIITTAPEELLKIKKAKEEFMG